MYKMGAVKKKRLDSKRDLGEKGKKKGEII